MGIGNVVVWSDYYAHLTFYQIFAILHNVKRERESSKVPKKLEKLQKKLLTNSQICDILITESERNTSKIGWRPTPNKERGIL